MSNILLATVIAPVSTTVSPLASDASPGLLSVAPPLPQIDVSIRSATLADIPFMDALQKLHSKQVGWMPTKQFEGKIAAGHVLIAEERREGEGVRREQDNAASLLTPHASPLTPTPLTTFPLGYCIAQDQYFKRDDVGIIYQMNVLPGKQRGLIGASLLKAQFERSAYGCKLYCCWCAQDIAANRFWEAMGFVPLAFRSGSEKKARTHIFWQKRIRHGDTTTPWWFPSKTNGGSIREDRVVLPIPPGTHWSDAKPMIFAGETLGEKSPALIGLSVDPLISGAPTLPSATVQPINRSTDQQINASTVQPINRSTNQRPRPTTPPLNNSTPQRQPARNGLSFTIPQPDEVVAPVKAEKPAKPPKAPKPKRVCDPRVAHAARELRDRWLEHVNAEPIVPRAKYDLTRAEAPRPPLLAA